MTAKRNYMVTNILREYRRDWGRLGPCAKLERTQTAIGSALIAWNRSALTYEDMEKLSAELVRELI